MQCGVGRYFMPAAHLLADTEKSSVPYKTPLKNHRERTILGVFVKLGVRTLIPISHILAISPALEHRYVAPPQVRQQLKPGAASQSISQSVKPGRHLRPRAASQTLRGTSGMPATQALCAEMANCSASRSGCSRKRHIPSACCSISPGQGHQAE